MPSDRELGYPLLRFTDAIAAPFDAIDQLVRDTPEGPGWSQLLDVDRCPDAFLPFLGQFVGVEVDPNVSPDAQRAQIKGEGGFDRGTPGAMIAAAQRYLTGDQHVDLIERAPDDLGDVNAYYLIVQTYGAETPDPPSVLEALLAAKPAGITLDYFVVGGATYAYVVANYASYTALQAAFPSYAALSSFKP
jgi:hypothetical protein